MPTLWSRPVTGSIVIAGQSNAVRMIDSTYGACDYGLVTYAGNFYSFRTIADPYSDMNAKSLAGNWQEGSGDNLYERLVTLLQSLPASQKHVLFWAQGEQDATVEADANAYESNLTTFIGDIHAASGLDKDHLRWSLAILHTGNTNTFAATVRTALTNVAAAGDGTTYYADGVDVSTSVGIADGVHWDAADRHLVGERMLTSANTLYGFSQRSTAA